MESREERFFSISTDLKNQSKLILNEDIFSNSINQTKGKLSEFNDEFHSIFFFLNKLYFV